ncbi:MAG: hypothetical protein ACOCXI_13980, partial [Chloroflexota bacterium]
VGVIIALVVTYVAYYYQRIATPSELYFFWVPVVIAVIYGWVAWRTAGTTFSAVHLHVDDIGGAHGSAARLPTTRS